MVAKTGKSAFLIRCFFSYAHIMANNDQQKLYDNATLVVEWISSPLPAHIVVRAITGILVSNVSLSDLKELVTTEDSRWNQSTLLEGLWNRAEGCMYPGSCWVPPSSFNPLTGKGRPVNRTWVKSRWMMSESKTVLGTLREWALHQEKPVRSNDLGVYKWEQ